MKAKYLMITTVAAALTLTACASTGEPTARESDAREVERLSQRMQTDYERAQAKEYRESSQLRRHENAVMHSAKATPQR